MENWQSYYGSQEKTLTGLKHALQKVNKNAFVCVWTDELGDDNNDAALRAEVLSLKNSTQSEIFIMSYGRFADFEKTFEGIGYVMDITDPNVVENVITLMKSSALCNKNKASTAPGGEIFSYPPTTIKQETTTTKFEEKITFFPIY